LVVISESHQRDDGRDLDAGAARVEEFQEEFEDGWVSCLKRNPATEKD